MVGEKRVAGGHVPENARRPILRPPAQHGRYLIPVVKENPLQPCLLRVASIRAKKRKKNSLTKLWSTLGPPNSDCTDCGQANQPTYRETQARQSPYHHRFALTKS